MHSLPSFPVSKSYTDAIPSQSALFQGPQTKPRLGEKRRRFKGPGCSCSTRRALTFQCGQCWFKSPKSTATVKGKLRENPEPETSLSSSEMLLSSDSSSAAFRMGLSTDT